MTWLQTLTRIGLCLVLSFPIGWEREVSHKTAGLRTHLLVALGCCLYMLISLQIGVTFNGQADPSRIAAQIVTGIGFLGGGAILRAGGVVRGMTTAASIWSVAAIGMACGAGYYAGAAVGSLATYMVLTALERWERWLQRKKEPMTLRIRVHGDDALRRCQELIDGIGLRPERTVVEDQGMDRVLTIGGAFAPETVSIVYRALGRDRDVAAIERITA